MAMTRVNWIGGAQYHNLTLACAALNAAFGPNTYLVGSALERRDYRDVDVRVIMADADFDRLFGPDVVSHVAASGLWSLTCASISEWLQARTGLPIDFQIQRQTQANEQHKGRPRSAIGLFYAPTCDDTPKYPGGG